MVNNRLNVLSDKLGKLRHKGMKPHLVVFHSGLGETQDAARAKYLKENKVNEWDCLIFLEIPSDEMIQERIKTYGKLN